MKFELLSTDPLTRLVLEEGISDWDALLNFVRNLPYGRNASRADFGLVMKEKKGTCSTKHAFLQEIADLNGVPDVQLMMGIYRMTKGNTPGIGKVLSKHKLKHIPEAHCYLRIDGERRDFTHSEADFDRIKPDLLLEKEIEPAYVVDKKVGFHQEFIRFWIREDEIPLSFEQVWQAREACIENFLS